MKISYEITDKDSFSNYHRDTLAQMLMEQKKVQGDLNAKIDKCKSICIATIDGKEIAVGAIKEETPSDFLRDKANVSELGREFDWELGYLYTKENHEGSGIGSNIVKLLLNNYGDENIMASTEVSKNPGMVKILEKSGFRVFGTPWKSNIHDNYLCLFLRFK